MLRSLLLVVLLPTAGLLAWLALRQPDSRADFVIASTEPRTLDPHRVSWLPEIELAAAMFEGLTRLNPETFEPEPAVASHWEKSADGRTYTFHLRETARWSTGEPVTAEDFRFAWLRVLDPRTEAQYASLLFVISGAEEYYRSRLNEEAGDDWPAEMVGIEVCDERKLRVRLTNSCPYFLELTSFVTLAPAHRPTLRRWAYRDGQVLRNTQHLWTRPGTIVTNGPFVLARWEFKRSIRLQYNPWYWDAATLGVRSIEAWIAGDPGAALIGYHTGRTDLVRWLDRPVAEVLQREQQAGERHDYYSGDRLATFFYRVNCRRPPLNNPDLRKALSLALDRRALCEHVLRLGERPAFTLVPPTVEHLMRAVESDGRVVCYRPPSGLGRDWTDEQRVAAARKYLLSSSFQPQAASRPLEIIFPPDAEQRALAEAIQAMWEETLGIRVVLRTLEPKVLSTRIRDLDYDVARSDWFGDYLDPTTFLNLFTSDSGQNRTGWSNPCYDRLLAEAAGEDVAERRFELLTQAEQILVEEELPILPVFHRRGNYLLSPRFTGLKANVRDLLPIQRVRPRR